MESLRLKDVSWRTSLSVVFLTFCTRTQIIYFHTHTLSLTSVELEPGDKATECHCLVVPKPSTPPSSSLSAAESHLSLSLGTYTIRWKRATSSHPHNLISTVSFPPIMAKLRPFTVTAGMSPAVFPVMHEWSVDCYTWRLFTQFWNFHQKKKNHVPRFIPTVYL